ncbi:MAG: hypothetical protein CL696_14985 [Chloroflexi bacterium]|nr:hypothetical protein [Chloroflexota bacterium]MDP6498934.1 hypothetical protein [Dehalococcoidia bacterium]MQG56100.1 hypothetical protein [SAR202 cluster bacterium]|tara:strand:+ start:5831 stop:6010 length:180 start_codon:yes stop_codon:yes gene_type:complete
MTCYGNWASGIGQAGPTTAAFPRKFGVTAMPTTVFVSSDGTIMAKSVGAIDANFLARAS